jgi:hypothetical protein
MSSHVRKSKKSLTEEKIYSSLGIKVSGKRLSEMLETVSLKDMPLEERRREANKPLYLIRYE